MTTLGPKSENVTLNFTAGRTVMNKTNALLWATSISLSAKLPA